MRAVALACLLFVAVPAVASQYIRLDGRYYSVTTGEASLDLVLGAMIVPGVQMTNCGRSNGQGMVFGSFTLYYGASAYMVPLSSNQFSIQRPSSATTIFELASTTGDMICLGQVADPTQASVLFASSFE